MKAKLIPIMMAAIGLIIFSAASFAHHGRAAFGDEVVSLDATITEFRFRNPHATVFFDVTGEDGEVENWKGEITAPNRLARGGWTKTSLQPGDKVKVTGERARNGSNAVRLSSIIFEDGTSLAPWTAGIIAQ